MLDSGASHNLMPKAVMDKLGLDITGPSKYLDSLPSEAQDLRTFDSKKLKCLGMIKDLMVHLAQIPSKSVMMDVVVVDVPVCYGMLLSRSWGARLGGTLQLDMLYATIPIFGGETKRLYQETKMAYTLSDLESPTNHPVYTDDYMECGVLALMEEEERSPLE